MNLSFQNNNQIENNLEIEIPAMINDENQNSQEDKEHLQILQCCVHYLLLQLEKSQTEIEFFPEFLDNVFDYGNIQNKAQHLHKLEQAINNLQTQQNVKDKQQIKYGEEQIAVLQQHLEHVINLNQELMMQLSISNDKNVKLVVELNNKQKQIQEITIQQQIDNIDENSIRIDIDIAQFKKNIQNLNMEREQTIQKMKDLLQQFQSNKQSNFNLNRVKVVDEQGIQNIINLTEETINSMLKMEYSIDIYKKELESNLQNYNDKEQDKIKQLLIKLDQNKNCFVYVRKVFEKMATIFKEFGAINQELYQNNQMLENQLQSLNNKNNEFEKKIENLMNELNEQNEEKKAIIEQAIYSQQNRVEIQSLNNFNKYDELYYGFIDYFRVDIGNMLILNQKFFFAWILNINSKQKDSELLESTRSFITGLQDPNKKIELDSMEQQLKKSVDLIEQIYSQSSSNSIVNQFQQQNFKCILKILQTVKNYQKEIENHKKTIQNTN